MYLIRFLVGNTYGIFLLALFIYYRADELFGISPYTLDQLALWLVSQSESTKTALLHVPAHSDHPFRFNPITDFGLIRSPISALSEQK
jgi:hypothetical protein